MVARPNVILGDDTKNFLDDDLLAGPLRPIREVGGVPEFFTSTHPPDDLGRQVRLHLHVAGKNTPAKIKAWVQP
jgi:hypothetical protein